MPLHGPGELGSKQAGTRSDRRPTVYAADLQQMPATSGPGTR